MFIKRTIECTFKFNSRFFKEEDGRAIGGPLFATFSDICMIKMENNVVTPYAHIFCRRFVDDIYSRQKLGDNVLFEQLNNYRSSIKLALEVNSSNFWTPNSPTSMMPINVMLIGRTQNCLHHGHLKLQKAINEIQSMVIFIFQKEYHHEEIPLIKE